MRKGKFRLISQITHPKYYLGSSNRFIDITLAIVVIISIILSVSFATDHEITFIATRNTNCASYIPYVI